MTLIKLKVIYFDGRKGFLSISLPASEKNTLDATTQNGSKTNFHNNQGRGKISKNVI